MPLKDLFDKFITKTKRTFYIISIIWSYLSIALFIRYGFLYLNETNDKIMSTLTFVISIVYFIVTTLMLFFKKKENKTIKKSFKFIVNVFKLIMISTAIITLFNSGFLISFCGITILIDIGSFYRFLFSTGSPIIALYSID